MTIIDRYILRQFLQVFLICFISLTGLYVVIDGFGYLEEFLRYSAKNGNLLGIMAEFYGYRTLAFFDLTSGTLTLIAATFTLAWLQRHNEMTAMLAAGIPTRRIMRPVIAAVAIITIAAVANRELIIPSVRDKISRNAQDLSGEVGKRMQPKFDKLTDVYFRGKLTYAKEQRISDPSFRLPAALDRYGNQFTAENAFYREPQDGRPGGYLLKGMKQPRDLAKRPSVVLGGQGVILTPNDTSWLEPDECFIVSDVTFEQLAGAAAWRYASTPELIGGLKNPSLDFGADMRVAIHSRVVQPLLDMTLLFMGLPLVLVRENRNMFVAVGLCVGVVVTFMLIVMAFQYLGSNYLISPALAAWCPLMIFVPVAVGMSEPLRKS